jgi:hypothetical protein
LKTLWMLLLIPAIAFGQNDAYPNSDRNLVAWYKLDGNYLDQISGSSGDPYFTGVHPSVDAKRGSAFFITNSSSGGWIALVNSNLLNGATDFSMSFFVKRSWAGANADEAGVVLSRGTKRNGVHLATTGTTTNTAYAGINSASALTVTIPWDRWQFCVFKRKNQNLYWYIDGKLDVRSVCETNALIQDDVFKIFIDDYNSARRMRGYIDEVCFWNRAVTANEIEQLYFGRWRQTLGEISALNQGQGLGTGD